MAKLIAFALTLLCVLQGGTALASPRTTQGRAIEIGGRFNLIDQNGRAVSEKTLLGKPSVIFFGYTYCPEVCPTTLTRLTHYMKLLGRKADRLNVVFVSVDSARDTPKQLRDYLSAFDPRIQGYTGSPRQIAEAARDFHVYYRRVALPGGSFAYDHSAAVYLMDAQGRFVEPIGYDEAEGQAMVSLYQLVGR